MSREAAIILLLFVAFALLVVIFRYNAPQNQFPLVDAGMPTVAPTRVPCRAPPSPPPVVLVRAVPCDRLASRRPERIA